MTDVERAWVEAICALYGGVGGGPHEHELVEVTGLEAALAGKEAGGAAAAAVAGHAGALNPHPIYLLVDEAAGLFEALGTASLLLAGHEGAANPHPQYTSAAEAAAAAPVQSVAGRTGTVTLAKADVGLANVDNTTDAAKPISSATQTALDGKQASLGFTAVPNTRTVAGKALSSDVTLVKADVGLGNVDNVSDANKPVSTAQQTALNAKQSTSEKGAANGYASLDAGGKVPSAQLPAGGASPFLFEGVLANDVTTGANVTPVSVTGLVFSFAANKRYFIEIVGALSAAAATTGAGLQFDVSAAVTSVWLAFVHQLANTGTLSGGSSIADDASVGVSSGVPTNAVVVPFIAMGSIITTGNTGTAQLRLRSETTAAITIKAGTIMRVRELP